MPRFWAVLLLTAPLWGEQRMLESVLPRGGTRGGIVEVTLHGQSLQNPREVMFYDAGIRATAVRSGAKPESDVLAKFEIQPDCQPGEHVLRLRTANALSEPVTFWVSPFPSVKEIEAKQGENDTPEKAQTVPLNSTVDGQILPGDQMDVDFYKVRMEAGQRLSVEAEAMRLGSSPQGGENDLMVRILDSAGRELAQNRDSNLYVQDPVASVIVREPGFYFIEIKQQVYSAPRLGWYRAHIGSFSRPLAIYPAGGTAGSTLDARILGDPAGERIETIRLPAKTGDFAFFGGAPSANTLRVSPYPNVLKSEGVTQVPGLPAALNGILTEKGGVDVFRFPAQKADTWRIRVYARTLGSPMDPRIWVRPAGSTRNLLIADDSKLSDLGYPSSRGTWAIKDALDPVVVFQPPADGDYELGIEDTRGMAGPLSVYRIEVEPLRDIVYTHITTNEAYPIPRLTGMIVPQGNRWTMDVQLAQGIGNRYKDDIELEARGLPKGVTMIAQRFVKGTTRLPVQFVAADSAEQQTALVELLARPVDPKAQVETGSRQGFALINHGNDLPLHVVFLDRFALAVTEPAPFHVELEQPAIPLAQNGEISLKVRVVRHGDFKSAVEIAPDWLPGNVSKGGAVTIKPEETEATFVIHAGAKAAAGSYRIAMNASTTGGDSFSGVGRVRVSSEFVELKVAEPYVTVTLKRTAVERGQKSEILATLEQKHPFAGSASASLKNLPKGVRLLEPARFTSKDTEVALHIEADPDALAGLYKDIACEMTFSEGGQTVHQQSGSGILRVDPARMAVSK